MRWQVVIFAAVVALAAFGGRAGTATATDPSTGDPVIAAVGDMACAPADSHWNGGAGTASNCGEVRTSQRMEQDPTIDLLLGLGDYQYGCGTPAEFAQSYGPSWGFFNSIIDPTAGNHEYNTSTNSASNAPCPDPNTAAQDYFGYFGAAARQASAGVYSFDLGAWHLISLNGNCSGGGVGGCGATSSQTQWLSADLSANTQPCVLAYWHQPRWTTGTSNNAAYSTWWSLLYQHHADLVLNGHVHTYARFPPLDPSGVVDTANGVTEVIAGTGGESLQSAGATTPSPKPLVHESTFGYLRMVLMPTGYSGTFVTSSGAVDDSFSATCHGGSPPPAQLTVGESAPARVQAGSAAAYTVTVTNPGTSPQTDVTLTDTPPSAAMAVSAAPSAGSCSGTAPITCDLGTLAAGASATVTVTATPVMPGTAVNAAAARSDQAGQVTSSKSVTVTAAPGTSYVGVSNTGFSAPSPKLVLGNTLQWSFLGPGSHSATDQTSGLGIFPDTGLVAPVDVRSEVCSVAGAYTFTDTATGHTIKLNVPVSVTPASGSTTTPFTVTWAASAPPSGDGEDVQVMYPGTTAWVSLFKAATGTSATFTPTKGAGTYKFRARLRALTGTAASGYTTAVTIKVT